MPRKQDLSKLEQQLAAVQRKIRQAKADGKKQARADDARRKIIAGALCETHALANPSSNFATIYARLLHDYVRTEDRPLFADVFHALLPPTDAAALLDGVPPPLPSAASDEALQTEAAA